METDTSHRKQENMLTEKQVEAYKQDGYLKVEGLFTSEEVKELNSEMNLIIDDWWDEESISHCNN